LISIIRAAKKKNQKGKKNFLFRTSNQVEVSNDTKIIWTETLNMLILEKRKKGETLKKGNQKKKSYVNGMIH